MSPHETEAVHETVRQNYAEIARANLNATPGASAASCCGPTC
jgi:hypothetical protein